MTVVVSLKDIIHAMDFGSDEFHSYLNKETGEIVSITDEEINAIQNGDDWNDYPGWQQEALSSANNVLNSSDYLPLPGQFDIHEYAIMERFCYSITDPDISNKLSYQIKGSGAFKRFKDAIRWHGVENDWYQFRDQALEEIALEWLEKNGIAFSRAD
jgi:hypothetical protein